MIPAVHDVFFRTTVQQEQCCFMRRTFVAAILHRSTRTVLLLVQDLRRCSLHRSTRTQCCFMWRTFVTVSLITRRDNKKRDVGFWQVYWYAIIVCQQAHRSVPDQKVLFLTLTCDRRIQNLHLDYLLSPSLVYKDKYTHVTIITLRLLHFKDIWHNRRMPMTSLRAT